MPSSFRSYRPSPAAIRWAGAFLLIAAGTAGLLWWNDRRDVQTNDRSQAELLETLKAERLLPARLSGGFRYATQSVTTEDDLVLLRQASQTYGRLRNYRGSPAGLESLQSEMVFALAGEQDKWRQALLSLEAATASFPESAESWSDLSAVQYSLALDQHEPIGFLAALDAADKALELAPRMPEALFNRGLCLQALGLWREAKATWENYLEEDGSSGWSDEARQHLQTLRIPDPDSWPKKELTAAARAGNLVKVKEIVRGFRSPSRRLLEEEILPAWGAAVQAGGPGQQEAVALLQAARAIATAYEELSGDTLYREAVETLEQAEAGRAVELATAHRELRAGVMAIDQEEDLDAAERHLKQALLAFGDSPFARRTELKLAILEQRKAEYPEALDRLHRLQEALREASQPTLLGESYWVEGMTHTFQGHLDLAAQAYSRARPLFEGTGEDDLVAGLLLLKAELMDSTGRAGEAWKLLQKPLSQAANVHLGRRLYQIYSAAAVSAWTAGHPGISLLYRNELQSWATSNPVYPVDSRLWSARFLGDLGEEAAARELLDEARDRLQNVPEGGSRLALEAEIRGVEGELDVVGDPAAAVAALEKTLESYRDQGRHVQEKRAWLHLGRARRNLENMAAAREAYVASLDLTEEQRRQLRSSDRAALLQNDRETFEELIDLDFRSGRTREALDWSERGRARTLLDRWAETASGAGAPVRSIAEVQQQLPPDLTVVEYALVRGKWLAWVISAQEVRGVDLQLDEEALSPRVQRWVGGIQREVPWSDLRGEALALYRALILPLRIDTPGDWVIVPEGILKDLPFAALHDGERFLIERHALSYAPSANFFLHTLERNRELPSAQPLRALVLGDPAFDEKAFPTLSRLEHAGVEASTIAGLYGTPSLLGDAATKARFLREAPASDIVQFSGHAWTRPESPLDSSLLLAGGVLRAEEIYRLRLRRPRLVLLSACSTASGPSRGGEGAESLARAFLAAGVPGVVASLWNVEDLPTSELVIELHRQLQREKNARVALQKAQLRFVKEEGPVAAWAAFQLIGDASFDGSLDQRPAIQ